NALGTKRVRGARPALRGLFLLIALHQGFVAPLGRKSRIRADAVEPFVDGPCALGRVDGVLLGGFNCFWHSFCSFKEFGRLRRLVRPGATSWPSKKGDPEAESALPRYRRDPVNPKGFAAN